MDTVRALIYVLLPFSIIGAIFLVSQGVVQTFKPYIIVHTLEGRSIVMLAKEKLGLRGREILAADGSEFVPFSAETRMSGINGKFGVIRKGAWDAIAEHVKSFVGKSSP